jgi:hypothetical protein
MQLAAVIEKPRYDLTLFKVHFGLLTLKGYTKGEHLLRFEAITHNTRQLGCGRVLDSAVRHHSLSGRPRPGTSWLSRPISVGGQAEILGISVGMLASCVVVTDEWTRIECYCDTVPRAFSDIESIGSFTLFIGRSGHSYYARPIGPLSGAAALGEFDLVIGGDCLPISPRSGPSTRCSGGWHPIRGSTFPYDQLGCQIKSYESGRLA